MSAPVPETLRGEEISHLRHELRTPVNQIVGYCELMLEDCSAPQFAGRKGPLDAAIASVRDVTSLIDSFLTPTTTVVEKSQILALYQALHAPQLRIIDAMSELLKVSSGSADDTFIADVCRVRDAAERLLPVDRPRAEPTSMFTAPALTVVPSESMGAKPRRSARILVVDDVEENRGVLQRRLEREGHSVLCASSGVEALKTVNEQQVDVILLDVMMPELDGYQTLERLKSSPETREVPVIMISALDDIASIVRCIERGAEDYLPKPFDPVLLRARISASLEKKELREREKEYLRDVMEVAAAAVAVERGGYSSGSLRQVAARSDELGTLARVFDSMMVGIRERESKLRGQIEKLRDEISGVTDTLDDEGEEVELLPLGETFANRYLLKKNVGIGGMGVVYLAEDLELGEQIAIKTLKPELLTSDETAMERFRNEIRLARRIAHRNIVRTHDFGKSDDVYFVTMEFVEGTTLRAVLDKRGCLGAHAVLAIARQLADALKCAHDEGIIHRDIKPQNLLIDQAGTLKVMDFGVARLAQRTSTLTQVGMVVGTPTYMAPEQLLDEEVDPRSDLYSTGVVLYECLTGRPPYEGRSPISLIAKILHEEANAPEALKPDVPHAVSAMVMQLLAKKPAERVQSAGALSEILAGLS